MKKNVISCMARLLIAICAGDCFASQDVKHAGNDFVLGGINLSSDVLQVGPDNVLQDTRTIDADLLEAAEEEGRNAAARELVEDMIQADEMIQAGRSRKQNETSSESVRSQKPGETKSLEVAKRRVGRPRKNNVASGESVRSQKPGEAKSLEVAKRRVGRPRKNNVASGESVRSQKPGEAESMEAARKQPKDKRKAGRAGAIRRLKAKREAKEAALAEKIRDGKELILAKKIMEDREARRRAEDPAKVEAEYLSSKELLISALNKYVYRRDVEPSEIFEYEPAWGYITSGDRWKEKSHSEGKFEAKGGNEKFLDLFLKLQGFLRSAFLYWQVKCGAYEAFDLARFCKIIDTKERDLLVVPSDKLLFVRKIFLELFYGIKYLQLLSNEMPSYEIKYGERGVGLDGEVAGITGAKVIDFADGVEKFVSDAALIYKKPGAVKERVCLVSKVERFILISYMSRRHKEFKEQVESVVRDADRYPSGLADTIRNEQLRRLAGALDLGYNTCYVYNSISDLFPEGHVSMIERVNRIKASLPCCTAGWIAINFDSLVGPLENWLIDAQYMLELGTVFLGLDDFITLLKHLNVREDGKWLSVTLVMRLQTAVNGIIEFLNCWGLCEGRAKKLYEDRDENLCWDIDKELYEAMDGELREGITEDIRILLGYDVGDSKFLLDKLGKRLTYKDVCKRRYVDILEEFRGKLSTLKMRIVRGPNPGLLNNPSEEMDLTPADLCYIRKKFENEILRVEQGMDPIFLPARPRPVHLTVQEKASWKSHFRRTRSYKVKLKPSPEVWEFLVDQSELMTLKWRRRYTGNTARGEINKRKADESVDEEDHKIRKLN